MDTPIKAELTLEARDGRISGALVQSNSGYRVELRQEDDGITLVMINISNGHSVELDTGLNVEDAVTSALHAMGTLAHVSFPGFEPVKED